MTGGARAAALALLLSQAACFDFDSGLRCRDSLDCHRDELCVSSRCEPREGRKATVTVDTTSATVLHGEKRHFSAAVSGVPGGVEWSVLERGAGQIDADGTFTPTLTGTFHVVAASIADTGSTAGITVAVPPVKVTLAPDAVAVPAGFTSQFSASASGGSDPGVVWSVRKPGDRVISEGGLYTAPAVKGTFHVVAAATVDPGATAVAVVSVLAKATALRFDLQPAPVKAGSPLSTLRVSFRDADGAVVPVTTPVSLSLVGGPDGAALAGTTSAAAIDGVASFSDLSVAVPYSSYSLLASASGLGPIASATFSVSCAADAGSGPYAVGGTITGLTAEGLVLQNNGADDLSVPAGATTFSFAAKVARLAPYRVTVLTQPHQGISCGPVLTAGLAACSDLVVPLVCTTPPSWKQVSAGWSSTLALGEDGALWAWGDSSLGTVGDGTLGERTTPVKIGDGFVSISSGQSHSLAVKSDGSLWAWGNNDHGQLGIPVSTQVASPRLLGQGFAAVSAGFGFSIGLKRDGTIWTWGDNTYGQLGDGTTTAHYQPAQIAGDGYVSISAARASPSRSRRTPPPGAGGPTASGSWAARRSPAARSRSR